MHVAKYHMLGRAIHALSNNTGLCFAEFHTDAILLVSSIREAVLLSITHPVNVNTVSLTGKLVIAACWRSCGVSEL